MWKSFKCLAFFCVIVTILSRLYLFFQLYVQQGIPIDYLAKRNYHQSLFDVVNSTVDNRHELIDYERNNSEFLVLDWTADRHIFQEENLIKCKFLLHSFYLNVISVYLSNRNMGMSNN